MTSSEDTKALRLLVVVAHPHDFTHMAGTCAHHVERGDSVVVVSVTGGAHTHNEKLYDELRKPPEQRDMQIVGQSDDAYADEKAHEMAEVCRLFGISDVRIMAFPDHPLELTDDMVRALAEVLYETRPHVLLTHAPYSVTSKGHTNLGVRDHLAVGIAVQNALGRAGTPDQQSKRPPHRVVATYYMGVEFPYGDIDLFIDITDQVENRVKAEILFTTQAHTPEFARKRLQIGAGNYGWAAGVAYAEPFIRARSEVGRHLTVTEHDLQTTEMSRKDHMARISQGAPE